MKLKILHVLANGPPDVNGYAIRTHGLMKAYSELPDVEVVGLTSPWYPDKDSPRELPMDITVRHLHLWKNQGDMVVFAVPLCVFKPTALFEDKARKQYITLWFYTEDIDAIVNSQTV